MTAAVDSSSNVVISQVRSLYICGGYVAGSEAWHTVFEVAIYRITGKHTGSSRLTLLPELRPPQIVCV